VRVCAAVSSSGDSGLARTRPWTIASVHIESQSFLCTSSPRLCARPTYNSNAFFMESFIDEWRSGRRLDPLEYRLAAARHWPDPGWRKCLQEVAAKSGWGRKLPSARGRESPQQLDMGGKQGWHHGPPAVATV